MRDKFGKFRDLFLRRINFLAQQTFALNRFSGLSSHSNHLHFLLLGVVMLQYSFKILIAVLACLGSFSYFSQSSVTCNMQLYALLLEDI